MSDRFFSEAVQYQAVLLNLEKHNGQLKCELCGKIIVSKKDCHFDHILAYTKGGKSTLENCQILCKDCNLSKSDKEIHDFILEEKAKRFMLGEDIENESKDEMVANNKNEKMTKEKFDQLVGDFIKKHGKINKVDFTREKNGLPSIAYVRKYYGTLNNLKLSFGLKIDFVWNRDNIWERLVEYSKLNPDFKQSDLKKDNNLPSLPCILSYYPEFKNFSDIKIALGHELNYELWTEEKVISACKEYLKNHKKIVLKDLKKENGLPTSNVIYRLYGSMEEFQKQIGSDISKSLKFVSKEELIESSKSFIDVNGNIFESRNEFMKLFPYSESVIIKRFGTFEKFIEIVGIKILNVKKAKYTKQEVDNSIVSYLKLGKSIPKTAKELTSLNLPSASTILRFYDDWKEPFIIFSKMIDLTVK